MSAAASKSSKAPSKPYRMFEETWIECEKKTKSPTTKKSVKSKKCKASKAASIVEADSDKTETVEKVVEVELFDPPEKTVVRQHIDHVLIFPLPELIIVPLTLNTTSSLFNRLSTQIHQLLMVTLFWCHLMQQMKMEIVL